MTTTNKLTDTQRLVLEHADPHEGLITWFPDNVKGGARKKVIDGLLSRELITFNGTDYYVALGGYDALGRARPMPAPVTPTTKVKAPVATTKGKKSQENSAAAKPTPRANSKQSRVIEMLRRPGGATVAQIMAETQWLAHTVRGCFAGVITKKLGFNLVSEKIDGHRHYRIG